MNFTWNVDLGSLINAVSLLVVALAGVKKLGVLEFKLNQVYSWFQKEHGIEE